MKTKVFGSTVAVRLDKGEEIFSCVEQVCVENGIKSGTVSGLGTTDDIVMGVYDIASKSFFPNRFCEFMEITNLTGNVTTLNGKTYIHLHITTADKSGRAYGGHLKTAVVGATAEIFITSLGGELCRRYDEETGLNIFEVE